MKKDHGMKMKGFLKLFFLAVSLIVSTAFVNSSIQKKIIRTKDFDLYFFVSMKNRNTTKDKMYHWYKSGEVHNSFGDAGGQLLHKEFVKYYNNNQIAEKGNFDYGVKTGKWKTWYKNGKLKDIKKYNKGNKYGMYSAYDENGALEVKGYFKSNTPHGTWINYKTNDTTWYKRGVPFNENPRNLKKREDSIKGKKFLLKRIFSKRPSTKNKKRPGFIKRFFSKKKRAEKDNG
ncbi:MAG: toxin-antitoxin system YwqK family antitoxin [Patiriisocius sp.]|uniref:toxin-antitoxin system YwqK family antitoxin n=1 Tax=Patiriisocius sp. TaxID=2822396 RepID=UPI003EF89BD2